MANSTSPDGIPSPTGTDQVGPLETWFANLAAKVQDAISAVRGEVANVHDVTVVPQTSFGTLASGYTLDQFEARRTGALVSGSIRIIRTGGFIHDATIFTVNPAFRPATAWKFTLPATGAGGGTGANTLSCNVDSAGAIKIYSPNGRTTAEISFTWVVANA